ncbi:MAG: hypothetical protein N2037_10835 [Acidimicrobiales bacterium]|nr:hypothetical protein [Acidimicrobiales bacterium]
MPAEPTTDPADLRSPPAGRDPLIPNTELHWVPQGRHAGVFTFGRTGPRELQLRAQNGALTVGLRLASGPCIDVSAQPGLPWRILRDTAATLDLHPAQVATAFRRVLVEFAAANQLWDPAIFGPLPESTALLGLCFPITRPALLAGADPCQEVPRWALPVLRQPDARSAATAAFGSLATRRVIRAFAGSLIAPERGDSDARVVGLAGLGFALMGQDVLDADRLATVLEVREPWHPEARWPTIEQISRVRQLLRSFSPARAGRLLAEAIGNPDGIALLDEIAVLVRELDPLQRQQLPAGLRELHEHCVNAAPADPNPPRERGWLPLHRPDGASVRRNRNAAETHSPQQTGERHPTTSRNGRRESPRAPAGAETHTGLARRGSASADAGARPGSAASPLSRALHPPVNLPPLSGNVALHYPPHLVRLQGASLGDSLTLALPRTTAELESWGRALNNCLGSFGPAVASAASWLVGVRVRGRLRYVAEVTPTTGCIRQFLGHGNHQVPRHVAAPVVEALAIAGVIDLHRPENRQWAELLPHAPLRTRPSIGE